MKEGNFLVLTIGIVVFVIVLAICASNMHTTRELSIVIQGGADPIAARCAMKSPYNVVICALKAAEPTKPEDTK